MPYYRILTKRFAEWQPGDIAAMDDEAARVPLEKGEIELYQEPIKDKYGEKDFPTISPEVAIEVQQEQKKKAGRPKKK